MNLCKNDCAFPENQNQYKQVPNKETPEKKKASTSRYLGKIKLLDSIWVELKAAHIDSIGDGKVSCIPTKETALVKHNGFRIDCTQFGPMNRKSNQRIISIRHLFSNTPKFQKNFSRGVFLTCLIYSEEKILVTFDDVLPTFQIDEDLSSSFQSDFHWLHKISCIWNDVKFLKSEMEKCDSASALHFRLKILQTIVTMQEALDLPDLGKVYYKPIITENNNVTFLCTVNHLRSTKLVSAPNVRWIPVEKLKCRKTISDTYEILLSSAQGLMIYHQMSNIPLGKGLYLGYFKLVSSVDLLKVFVPEKTPSILPHVKIRNNPHVTKEEWDLLSMLNEDLQHLEQQGGPEGQYANVNSITETQLQFRQSLDSSLKKLFSNLKIDRNSALNHRFYTTEIVEISSSVTFIMLLPPTENVCLIEGDDKELKWMEVNKLMTLPIQVFEMTHVLTYHNTLARRYMRLSATIEVETALAQHNKRKAFSSEEMSQAQHNLTILSSLQTKLESTWRDCRWILEMVKASRAKEKTFATLRDFLNRYNTIQVIHSTNSSVSCTPSSSNASTPSKKFSRGTYVNTGSPYHLNHINSNNNNNNSVSGTSASYVLNKNQLQTNVSSSIGGKSFPVAGDLPGPPLPSNPNFKYESCSSLPIVSKNSPNYERLRTTASLHNLKLPNGGLFLNPMTAKNNNCSSGDGVFLMSESSSVMQELDSYMRHTSSRSKLVSLSSMTHKFKDNYGGGSFGDNHVIPGMNEPRGLTGLSWTKQRGSLDRCFSSESEPYYANCPNTISNSSGTSNKSNAKDIQAESSGGTDSSRNSKPSNVVQQTTGFGGHNGHNNGPGRIVEIYAAYDSGLSFGSCVKLQITSDTTSKQIIELMVRKIDEETMSKSSSTTELLAKTGKVEEFCLVSVIGARERVLRMDYKPLQLQNPWDSARLFVRRKTEVTAAVDLEGTILANNSSFTV